jgi:hypothetical protein
LPFSRVSSIIAWKLLRWRYRLAAEKVKELELKT